MKSRQILLNIYAPLHFHFTLLPLVLLAFVVQSSADGTFPPLFRWGFGNGYLSRELPTCTPLQIVVNPLASSTNNTLGTPPYYMMGFVLNGTSGTTFIGNDPKNLSYTVTEPVGSQLALSVIDANGRTGGIPPIIYTVIDSQSTDCVTTPSATPKFEITANVTTQLSTCQPWGITIAGGVPPYTLVLQAVNAGGTTNVTIPFGDDAFTYINRSPPNTQLLGALSDFTGRWANGTAVVNTIGSTDADCTGFVSSSGNSTVPRKHKGGDKDKDHSRQRQMQIIIPVLSVVLVSCLIVAGFLYLRTRIKQADAELNEITPRPWIGGCGTSILSMKGVKYIASTPSKGPSFQQDNEKISSPAKSDPPPTMSSLSPTSTNITNVPNHTHDQAIEKKGASPVQPDPPPSTPSLSPPSTNIINLPNRTSDQESQDFESRPFSISDYGSFGDTVINAPQSMYFLPAANFATFPRTPIRRSTPQLNPGPEKRIKVVNQNRRASGVEAELFYNEHEPEPALSDTGSNVLPRSVSYTFFSGHPQQRPESESRYGSEGSRDSSTTLA